MHILYLTVNKINDKFYIGVHKQKKGYLPEEFDGYYGSGHLLKKAIKKYGKENFERITLCYDENRELIYKLEKYLVDETNPASYNLAAGGIGGFAYVNEYNRRHPRTQEDFLQARKKAVSTLLIKYGVDNPGKLESSTKKLIERNKEPQKQETIEKRSVSLIASGKVKGSNNGMYGMRGELAPCYGRSGSKHPMFNMHHTEEAKNKIKNNENLKKAKPKVECPNCGKIGGNGGMGNHIKNCKVLLQ